MSLELTDLERAFPDFTFGPVSLTVEPGVTAVLGPSGSGKSTLLSLVAGFESPDAGHVAVDGVRIDDRPPEDRSVGMVFQSYALFPHLSVRENLAFGAADTGRIEPTARLLEIETLLDRDPGTLSGGEAQRVALARALVSDPDVLLLDEPLSSLDAPIRRRLRVELRDILADLEIPVVYVTHDQAEAAVVGDRLAVLNDGQLVRAGPTEAVFERPESAFVAEFLGIENVYPATVRPGTTDETVATVGGVELRSRGEPPAGDLAVAIHPESVQLDREAGPNSLDCTVDRVLTQHTDATVLLDWPGPDQLTATVSRSVARELSEGDTCPVRIPPEAVHLTRRDR